MAADPIRLSEVRVRLVRPAEVERFNALLREHHYLGFRKMAGRRLRHVAEWRGRWLALLGWHAAALHCAARDRWIGWTSLQRRTRLFLVTGNTRFCLLPGAAGTPRLASRVLGLSLRRLAGDWLRVHRHAVLLAESFVDEALFRGTCYRAANWIEVGRTRGFGRTRSGPLGYVRHGRPKRVFVYPLRPDARQQLAAAAPRPEWRPWMPKIKLTTEQLVSLWRFLERVTDQRGSRGLRYPLPTVLTIVLAAKMAGADTLTRISHFGRALSQKQLRRIGSRRRPQTGRYHGPAISTLHYVLKQLDPEELERLAAAWLRRQAPPGGAVAIDGKHMRGSYDRDLGADGEPRDEPAQQQVTAVGIGSGVVVGQLGYSGKKEDAEAAALRKVVLELEPGTVVVADALHTQRATAQLLEDLGMYYVFTVKDNQPRMLETIREMSWDGRAQHTTLDGDHGRIETRTIMVSDEIDRDVKEPWIDFPGARFVARVKRRALFKKTGKQRDTETAYLVTNLPPELATRENLLALNRGYWGAVENGIHWVRDAVLNEDASRVRKRALPRVMAALSNLAISILRLLGANNIASTMDELHLRCNKAVKLLRSNKAVKRTRKRWRAPKLQPA